LEGKICGQIGGNVLNLCSGSKENCDEISEDKLDIHMSGYCDIITNYSKKRYNFS